MGSGLEVKMLDYSPPCYRLQGRLSQTEIFHFGSSLHLKSTNTKTIVFFPPIDCEEHSEGLGRQKISKDQHNNNNSNNKKMFGYIPTSVMTEVHHCHPGKKKTGGMAERNSAQYFFFTFLRDNFNAIT